MKKTLFTFSFKTKLLRFLAVCATLALIAGGVFLHSKIVERHDINNDKTTFFEEDNYDVLFFGSSHMRMAVTPFELFNNYGVTSYNLGVHVQYSPVSYHILKAAITYHKPKIAVLDVFNYSSNYNQIIGNEHVSLDNFPLSKAKIEGVFDLYKDSNTRFEMIFPYSIYHHRWTWIGIIPNLMNIKNRELNLAKGFNYPYETYRVNRNTSEYKNMEWVSKDTYIENKNTDGIKLEYIKKFVEFCKENDIQPILIYLPPASNVTLLKESNSMQKIANELNVPYYDMLYNANEIIDADIDFNDWHSGNTHLNLSGARKVTNYIGKILQKDFNLPDHRNDPKYAHWQTDYHEYRNYIFNKMAGMNDLDTLLMACYFDGVSVQLFKKDGVTFDTVEQKLIAQLKDNIQILSATNADNFDVKIIITDTLTDTQITEKTFYIGSRFRAG